jgi:hypothetical protein
MVHVY